MRSPSTSNRRYNNFDLTQQWLEMLNWTCTTQQDYQDLFHLEEGAFSKPLLEYRSGDNGLQLSNLVRLNSSTTPFPFRDFQFDLALSSYPFFNDNASSEQVFSQLKELLRVAKEVRLAPHQLEVSSVSTQFGPVLLSLQKEEVGVEITPLTHVKNAVMLRLWANVCKVG